MLEIEKGISKKLPVLVTQEEHGMVGVEIDSIGISYSQNFCQFVGKALSGSWSEVGNGLYAIDFSAEELDTEGFFVYAVSGSGFDQFTGLVYVKP